MVGLPNHQIKLLDKFLKVVYTKYSVKNSVVILNTLFYSTNKNNFMKFFQRLILAPVALGMVTPVAAGAKDLNMAAVSQYSSEQVTSVTQFSDVQPTDWAYQALSQLVERYGCVAGYPNGTFRGGSAMTRYEAAALLNACLDRVNVEGRNGNTLFIVTASYSSFGGFLKRDEPEEAFVPFFGWVL